MYIEKNIKEVNPDEAMEHIRNVCKKNKGSFMIHQFMYDKLAAHAERTGIRPSNIIEQALTHYFGFDTYRGLLDNREIWRLYKKKEAPLIGKQKD